MKCYFDLLIEDGESATSFSLHLSGGFIALIKLEPYQRKRLKAFNFSFEFYNSNLQTYEELVNNEPLEIDCSPER